MSSHTLHPDSHVFGLADDCPRCDQHAQHPFDTLDYPNLVAIYDRVRREERPRSENEGEAMRIVADCIKNHERLDRAILVMAP